MAERDAAFMISFVVLLSSAACRPSDVSQESTESESSSTESESESGDPETDTETETETGQSGVPETPTLELSFSQVKQFDFTWSTPAGAEYYYLLESADVGLEFEAIGFNLFAPVESTSRTTSLHFRNNASYKLQACNMEGCSESAAVDVTGNLAESVGYFKASNTQMDDTFGYSIALSSDSRTLVVGAPFEDSGATGVGGDQADNSETEAGAVYVFVRDKDVWSQQAYIKASNTGDSDLFGYSVSLSELGDTLAVGALEEDSLATGIDGDGADDGGMAVGAAYVFVREGGVWSQQAYIKASNAESNDRFGVAVALSGDGDTLAVGADFESSGASGIDGDQDDNSVFGTGAVYVFDRDGAAWSQQAYIKASNPGSEDRFSDAMALSFDGNTLAVGAPLEDSGAVGIDGNQADESQDGAGAVYVFARDDVAWSQQAYVKPSNTAGAMSFGVDVSLSSDGNTMAVGASGAESAYVFVRNGVAWSEQAQLVPSNNGVEFGTHISLASDGDKVAVTAHREGSGATGIGGDQSDELVTNAGAAYVFVLEGDVWSQAAYVKASNTEMFDLFGADVALSGGGNTLAVASHQEDSSATGIGGDQTDDSADGAGAVYLY